MQVTNKNIAKVNNTTISLVSKQNNYDMMFQDLKLKNQNYMQNTEKRMITHTLM